MESKHLVRSEKRCTRSEDGSVEGREETIMRKRCLIDGSSLICTCISYLENEQRMMMYLKMKPCRGSYEKGHQTHGERTVADIASHEQVSKSWLRVLSPSSQSIEHGTLAFPLEESGNSTKVGISSSRRYDEWRIQ